MIINVENTLIDHREKWRERERKRERESERERERSREYGRNVDGTSLIDVFKKETYNDC